MPLYSDDKLIVVYKEWTIGTLHESTLSEGLFTIGILTSSIIKGGIHWMQSPLMMVNPDDFRPATIEDCHRLGLAYQKATFVPIPLHLQIT